MDLKSARSVSVALLVSSLFSSLVAVPSAHGFQTSGQYASTVIGEPNFYTAASEATANHLASPFRITFDSMGDLWVADELNNRVLEFKPPFSDGESASLVIGQQNFTSNTGGTGRSGVTNPVGLAFDPSGDLWVVDTIQNRVLEFKPPFSNGMNASLELGQRAGPHEFETTNESSGAGGLNSPVSAAFDGEGNLWISDRENNRILEFKPPFTSGMNASSVIGQVNTTSVPIYVGASPTGLVQPNGIRFDAHGNLWVADETANRLLEFPASSLGTDDPQAALEIGQPAGPSEFYTSAVATNRSGLASPIDIAFDPQGNLWVTDRSNNRILEFDSPFSDGMSASSVIGPPPGPRAFDENETGLSQTKFYNPLGLAFDPSGNLWITDELNDRVLEFSGAALGTYALHVNIPVTSAQSQVKVSGGDSCYQTGVQNVCHLVADENSTGVDVDAIGVASATDADIYTSLLDPQLAPDMATSPITSPIGLYGAVVDGFGSGTASVCIKNSSVAPSTVMAYYSGSGTAWGVPSSVSRAEGSSICGTIPLSSLSSENSMIVIGPSNSISSGVSGESLALAAVLSGSVLVCGYAIFARKRDQAGPEEEPEEEDETW